MPFYKEFANQGLTADDCPIIAFCVAEDELRAMDTSKLVGHLAAWNYFQSHRRPRRTRSSSTAFKACAKKANLPGGDRVTDDPIEAAYYGVYVWKKAAEKAGSFDVDKVREAVYGHGVRRAGRQEEDARERTSTPTSRSTSARSCKDGQFKIVEAPEGPRRAGAVEQAHLPRPRLRLERPGKGTFDDRPAGRVLSVERSRPRKRSGAGSTDRGRGSTDSPGGPRRPGPSRSRRSSGSSRPSQGRGELRGTRVRGAAGATPTIPASLAVLPLQKDVLVRLEARPRRMAAGRCRR